MDTVEQRIVEAVAQGATIEDAAEQAGVNEHTLRRCLSNGRENDGPHVELAREVDAIRKGTPNLKALTRGWILAVAEVFAGDGQECPPEFTQASRSIQALSPIDLGMVMVELAWHVIVAALRLPQHSEHIETIEDAIRDLFVAVDKVDAKAAKESR
jgi:transposase-like protein